LDRLVRLPGAFDAYESSRALPLARWIIRNFSLDSQAGGVPSVGFSYNLAGVFERALARMVAQRLGVPMRSIAQRSWTFTAEGNQLDTKEGTCRPDLYITADGQLRPLVADTKWKAAMAQGEKDRAEEEARGGVGVDTFTSSALRVDGIKLINADIYQILSYAYLASRDKANKAVRGEAIPGALVYPVKNKAKDDRLRIKLVERDQDLELYLIPWVVGDGQLQKRTEEVVTLLLELRKQRGT
jgi:5-methylcytosine-specific restriction endonuclease McrBC regulatory subunit McrC